jgi:DNA-binding NtrC family response regulator
MEIRVLLVDDESELLDVMSERLRVRGMNVATAESAQAALDLVGKESFDAVVMDLSMPVMDGIQALKEIHEKRPELQVILLTGYGTIDKGVESIKLGAFDFLEKPADIDKLVSIIHQARVRRLQVLEKQQEDRIREIVRKAGA